MEVEIKNGKRIGQYVNLEETGIVFVKYNPNTGPHYGLYDHYPYQFCSKVTKHY
jgi:hypothetical protein